MTGVSPPTLDQIAMASFIEDASLERHLQAMRRHYRAKREALIGALGRQLPAVRVGGTAPGLHLVAWLPDGTDEHATAMAARQAGVGLHELHRHCTTRAPVAARAAARIRAAERVRPGRGHEADRRVAALTVRRIQEHQGMV